jgi:DNA-directed RNA polymerase subunit omega
MLFPSIDELVKKVDSKYSLVVAASRRARTIRDGAKVKLDQVKSSKHVGIALEEIYHDLIRIEQEK